MSERIARLEAAAREGQDVTRDLEVVERFLSRAEGRVRNAARRRGAYSPGIRRSAEATRRMLIDEVREAEAA